MNSGAKEIPCLTIYSLHNYEYLVLPNTILKDIPKEYQEEVESYLVKKILSFLDRLIEVMRDAYNIHIQNLDHNIRHLKSENIQITGILFFKKFFTDICSLKGLPKKFANALKKKLDQGKANGITVGELWQWTFKNILMYINQQLYNNLDQFDAEKYGYSNYEDAEKKIIKLIMGKMCEEAEKQVSIKYYTVSSEIVSAIFQDKAISKNLLISSLTTRQKENKKLDFTGELTLDISMEEFQFLIDSVCSNNHTSSYVAKIYTAFKKNGSRGTLKDFFSKRDKINQENKATRDNIRDQKGEDEANQLYQAYEESAKNKPQSFKEYLNEKEASKPIEDLLKALGLNQTEKEKKANLSKTKKAKMNKQGHKKPIEKRSSSTNNTESELISKTITDRCQNKKSNNRLVPDPFEYHSRVKKWEQDPDDLLAYFRNVSTGPDLKYKKVNSSPEKVTEEKFRHDVRPVGQITKQPDKADYFFTLGNTISSTGKINRRQSALAVLSDNNGKRQQGIIDIAITETVGGKEMIYHQMFRCLDELETIFKHENSSDTPEKQPEQSVPVLVSNRSLYKDTNGTYVITINENTYNKFLRILPWNRID
ncbi:DUF1609 domain-containing protein [Candidatus Cardinium hertigii]|nr:DUF1609 domain-containing protein [Candidatus Cardinium hertigii]